MSLPESNPNAQIAVSTLVAPRPNLAFETCEKSQVVEVSTEHAWCELKDEWSELLARSESDSLFLTHEWITAWWSQFGRPRAAHSASSLFVIAIRRNGLLRAAAPFTVELDRVLGVPTRVVRFLGHGASDYLDLIVAEDRETLLTLIVAHLAARAAAWDIMELGEFSAHSMNLTPFRELMTRAGLAVRTVSDSVCSSIQVTGEWDAFLQTQFSGPRRKKFRAEWRHLAEVAPLRLHFIGGPSAAEGLTDRLAEIERAHPAAGAGTRDGVFRDPLLGGFLRCFLPIAAERGWAEVALLDVGGCDAAYQLWFRYCGRLYGYAMAYHARYAGHGPGKLLLLRALEHYWQRGISEIDLLRGGVDYKRQFATSTRQNLRLCVWHGLPGSQLRAWLRFSLAPLLACRVPTLAHAFDVVAAEGWSAAARRALARLTRRWTRRYGQGSIGS